MDKKAQIAREAEIERKKAARPSSSKSGTGGVGPTVKIAKPRITWGEAAVTAGIKDEKV